MKRSKAYSSSDPPKRLLVGAKWYFIIFVYLLIILPCIGSFAQDYPDYEEIALFLDVPELGGREMDVLIKGNDVYLPITDLFDFLMIRNIPSPGLDTISGFFINQEAVYHIDKGKSQIQFRDELYEIKPGDFITTETNLFLKAQYFGEIFGLDSEFSFRTMSVRINTNLELPAIREMRLQAMRKNMNRLVGEPEADTIVGRSYPLFHFGMADWSANLIEHLDGPVSARLGLALGGILAGGEATVALNYNTYTEFTEKQQYYLWRYVNNENRAVRQVMAGKIATGATSSIYDPVVGAKITNTSTQFRRSFGTYTLSDHTEPEWIVELYVNNVLVDYTTADASGFFTFEVPLVYGNTQVRLKFYGPWGEERTREQNITIPFNFIPKKTLEYSISGGMVEDDLNSLFSRSVVHYGLSRSVTIGTGVEYLSSVTSGKVMPFVNGSFRLASNLLLSGEYSPEVRSLGTLSYRLPSSLQFDINYIYYKKGQTAINNNFREERKVSMSMPIRIRYFSVYNRISVNQLVLPTTNYTTGEWLISGTLFGVGTNLTTYAVYITDTKPYYYSDFSMSFRLPQSISIQPRIQYSYSSQKFLSAKVLVEKRLLKKAYLTASYEQNFRSNMHLVEIGFRYDFDFAQTSIATRITDRSTSFIQYARGSIINDSQTNYVSTDNRGNVGKGGISIIPFLDKNANGIREPGEPKVYGLNLRASAGRIEKRDKDTTIRIFGLEPYTYCFIEFDQGSFDNIAWRFKNRTMNIAVDPNLIKLVEIPINVVGEAAGMVRMEKNGVVKGLARIIVNIYDKDQNNIGRTLSEDDGYFSFFGLYPGSYDARIDSSQLRKLGMISSPDSVHFVIASNLDGDYIDGLDFIVKLDTLKVPEKEIIEPETIDMIVYEEIEEDIDATIDSYDIQIAASISATEADSLRNQLSSLLGKEVNLFREDNLFKIRVRGFATRDAVKETFPILQSKGINEISLITVQGMLTTTKTITIVQEITEEDTSSTDDSYAITIGAFENEAEADTLRSQLSSLTGKELSLFSEEGLYKIRVNGFDTREEVKESFPTLQSVGISEIGLISIKGMLPATKTTDFEPGLIISSYEMDTTIVIVHEIFEEDPTSTMDSYAIQLGAFKRKKNADMLRKKLADALGRKVDIITENGFHKVRIYGLKTSYEVKNSIPNLVKNGFREIWIINLRGTQNQAIPSGNDKPATELIDTFTKNDTTYFVVQEAIEEVITTDKDSYAIQLGAFGVKINADVLKLKIATMLDKEVEIIVDNELYYVIIPDFQTRDEVEAYIPVLIKNGVSEMKIVNIKGKQQQKVSSSQLDTIAQGQKKVIRRDTTYLIKKKTVRVVNETLVEVPVDKGPRKETVEVNPELERRKTLEERLLEAEYRSGLYEARWPGVEFTIQIAASKSISDPDVMKRKLEITGDVEVIQVNDWYRFTSGRYIKFWKAREYRNILMSRNGIEDAFIIAYKDGKRIMLTDLLAMVETMIDVSSGITARPVLEKAFSIQVLATKDGNMPVSEIRKKYDVDEDIFKEYTESDGLYRYSIGNFNTYTEAAKLRNKIRASGFREAFVVGFKEGKRVDDLNSLLE